MLTWSCSELREAQRHDCKHDGDGLTHHRSQISKDSSGTLLGVEELVTVSSTGLEQLLDVPSG